MTLTDNLKIKGFVMSRFDLPLPAVYISDKNHLQFEYEPPAFEPKEQRASIHSENKTSFINIVNITKKVSPLAALKNWWWPEKSPK